MSTFVNDCSTNVILFCEFSNSFVNLIHLFIHIMEISIGDRINMLIDKFNRGSQKEFAAKVGIGATTLNNIVSGRKSDPSYDVINKILSKYTIVNSDWLITGKGDMLLKNENSSIPYYDVDVTASNIDIFNDGKEFVSEYMTVAGFKDCDFACNVAGNSMAPHINSGDIIICKKLTDTSFINFGETYLVITPEQRLVKQIRKSEKEEYIKMVSRNPEHDPFDLHKSKILNLFIVKGRIERKIL